MHRPPVAGHGGVVDRGAHQWVAEADPDAEVDQFRRLGRGGCFGADAQLTSGPPEQTHLADRFRGRDQQQQSGVAGQRFHAAQEVVLDARRQGARVRYGEAAGELVRREPTGQLLQRQRVAVRLGHDPVAYVLVQRRVDRRGEQAVGIRLLQPAEHQCG